MATLFTTLYAPAEAFAQARQSIEDAVLYDRGTKLIDAGQFEKARLMMQTLINFYPATPLRQQARAAIRTSWVRQGVVDPDPMLLYQEGQTRAAARNKEAALLAFQTLINLYPTSEYAQKAKQAASTLESHDE
jgi:outer membrane protein assembly factor BamD (BamD/ComL family)